MQITQQPSCRHSTEDWGRGRQRFEFTFQSEQSLFVTLLVAVDKANDVLGELRAVLPERQGV